MGVRIGVAQAPRPCGLSIGWSTTNHPIDSLARVRQYVGEDEFERAVAAGDALSFDEAFDLARGKIGPT